jgi:hypothetical protein
LPINPGSARSSRSRSASAEARANAHAWKSRPPSCLKSTAAVDALSRCRHHERMQEGGPDKNLGRRRVGFFISDAIDQTETALRTRIGLSSLARCRGATLFATRVEHMSRRLRRFVTRGTVGGWWICGLAGRARAAAFAKLHRVATGCGVSSLRHRATKDLMECVRQFGGSRQVGTRALTASIFIVLTQACSIEQRVSGPILLTGEWQTIEPPQPLRVGRKEQQKLCLQVGKMRDLNFENGVALDDERGQRHMLEGEAFDKEGTKHGLTLAEAGGDHVCLYRAGDNPAGPDFRGDLVRLRLRSEPPLQVEEIRWYSHDQM